MKDNLMEQIVEAPTRKNTQLDLIKSNNTELITDVQIRDSLDNSDHGVITFEISYRRGMLV